MGDGMALAQGAVERLYEDEALRGDLTDEGAKAVLDWATGALTAAAEEIAQEPDEQARATRMDAAEEAVVRVAKLLVRAAERADVAGVRLGFHNHDAEIVSQADGRSVLDLLLAADGGPFLELDLGWAWYAGADPIALLEAAGPRAPLVHVKDMRRADGPVHVPLGRGSVDYVGLAGAAERAGVEWLIVEQDESDGDAFEAVAESVARLRSLVEVPA